MSAGRRRVGRTSLLTVAVTALVAVPFLARLESGAQSVLVVPASADAFVLASAPAANRGGADVLRALRAEKVAYLRFEVPALVGGDRVRAASLRLHSLAENRCDQGVEVLRAAGDEWDEATISWDDQPGTVGSVLSIASRSADGSIDLDVTPAVTGSGAVSFVVSQAAGCDASFADVFVSREGEAGRQPQLIVETDPEAAPATACSDGTDNDGDGLVDDADPGCTDPSDGSEVDAADGVVVAAAGDIACDPAGSTPDGSDPDVCQHRATADLLAGADAVLPLGDLQYPDGTLEQFLGAYEPSWGVHAPNTYPSVGNHEYHVPGAQGYFDYWASKGRPTGDPKAGYHSFDLGSWHVISLNSNCSEVDCAEGSAQNDWLEQDLAATTRSCVLAYWHHPLFNSGLVHGDSMPSGLPELWDDLYAAGVDVVLNGHEHNYQRYAKQAPNGAAAADGIREFVVGTGGSRLYGLQTAPDPNYEAGQATDFGVLRLWLDDGAYSWEFVSIAGAVMDSGGPVPCN
ncbi:MAG TPA: DNRLRE domain-containing protein [Actinomycetota bacterium]|nr:DNRLRE domain-containing protein [Actinomycetota bacterium]